MKLLAAVLVALSLLLPGAWGSEASRTCIFQTLSESDSEFCRGDLEVIYPEVGDVSCSYIPKCHGYRRQLSHEWGKPRVRYPWAKKHKKYVLVMVDPDSPNRADPRNRFWRHWLVTDILRQRVLPNSSCRRLGFVVKKSGFGENLNSFSSF
ncbi:phosphatidylethanolamine-binding protein 4 [Corvus kubaryi]|uniref:phosphatidylethanolamine-binding protein 4 n=1 Tax=Corvus kubaryi TaxID=68294 RepID=UPI001C04C8E1|nr:phosphatidylethanolamine-binding protein 4 [Corvus kubaryi]